MHIQSNDSFKTKGSLKSGDRDYTIFNLQKISHPNIRRLPVSLKVLLENLLRHEDGLHVTAEDIQAFLNLDKATFTREISFFPARVLMQDFTGVPAVVDLAAMRDAMASLQGDPKKINPLVPVDLVIDHSVMVDSFGTPQAFDENVKMEFQRNHERYVFLKWGQKAFQNFKVVPPGTGICHQVNLEYLGKTVWTKEVDSGSYAFPDTLVGTDSHTTMINGLSVLGWGVGGIEAEAVMLGQPLSMLVPEVIGFKIEGKLSEGVTATDLVLVITQMLRKKGVVGKFVEFYGHGLASMSLADRATIANMAPEYGATCGFFPVDDETLKYLRLSGRDSATVALVEKYAKETGLWRSEESEKHYLYQDTLSLDLSQVEPALAGPKRPQDRVVLKKAAQDFNQQLVSGFQILAEKTSKDSSAVSVDGSNYSLGHGDVVIAAITSCTNTSNPSVMIGAGLVAKKAVEKGLKVKPWVKTSLAPGSQVVTDYLEKSGVQKYLDQIGFNLVGYGCTTCIGNSGPLPQPIANAVERGNLVVASVLSGNRNFEGRINPHVKANYLASPMLVVAHALAGSMQIDITKDSLGKGADGNDVYLKDIWPSTLEIQELVNKTVETKMFDSRYGNVFDGTEDWKKIETTTSQTYSWDESTYIKNPPYFKGMQKQPGSMSNIKSARILAVLGDSITTDHISPAGSIKKDSPAGRYLIGKGVDPVDFNSYGARRGNDEVMVRGTFANIRIKNEMLHGVEGGLTKDSSGEVVSIYDAAMKYQKENTPLVVVAGKEYGTGSSRDWAAKGTRLLGVKAVIAESFERIHRSNLIGMGVLPLQFHSGVDRKSLKIDGTETIDLVGIEEGMQAQQDLKLVITNKDGHKHEIKVRSRIDTAVELEYYKNGGILHYVLRKLM
ncbi:aconitate hydratase AcnA [Bdellovibrio reynosensis]|uniref:Aconitate hydratase n=1 Tax=Bdellovibrio reynosensis TaxID=2835041 RepID=A0ABY4C8D8_9BACT|nr:aconitate hydratase AcnA [Bdellovibrio reynosensis]UOF01054.1 aconitate hydratase AcnA [Bdellovibrio reynosensis]